MKLQKGNSFSILTWIQNLFEISQDFKWLSAFVAYFSMMTHIITCIWIIMANMDSDRENSWKVDYADDSKSNVYLTAFYFTVTTITTVGYGDMSASTFSEKIMCVLIMISGVFAFSLATGALTNYISQQDMKSEITLRKIGILERL